MMKFQQSLMKQAVLFVGVGLALGACATTVPAEQTMPVVKAVTAPTMAPEADREAIKAMAGNYKVSFDFTETVVLKDGYELKEPKLSGGYEVVRVIADEPGFISLQHILVVGKKKKIPIKHWRQDWIYEPAYVYDFVGFNSWKKRELSEEERRGKWAQVVYQVDDSPRYAAVAAWDHENGLSSWAAPAAMRPLPRRDMTTRDDYHGMFAVNRHVLTPSGWVHEQYNTKMILTGDEPQALVREIGVNTYVKYDDFDIAVADDYWAATKDYWAGVREAWTEIEDTSTQFGLTLQGEPEDLYMPVLELADEIQAGDIETVQAVTKAATVIAQYTTTDIENSIASAKTQALAMLKEGDDS